MVGAGYSATSSTRTYTPFTLPGRAEELKREYPNQSGTDRQEQIREEWKVSDENPKAGK
ncbi:hypothetical protein B0A53_06013 [Rhodotorula sp. CCFEE 5036]|nr:hypothetical protein B0A53_06013 [Rhodotorula sp. CCFEE 5036]